MSSKYAKLKETVHNGYVDLLTKRIQATAKERIEGHKQKDSDWVNYLTPNMLSDELFLDTRSIFSAIYNLLIGSKIDEALQKVLDDAKMQYYSEQK